MIYKILPYLLIIVGVVGFFVDSADLGTGPNNFLANLIIFLVDLLWWGNILSIIIGILLCFSGNLEEQPNP